MKKLTSLILITILVLTPITFFGTSQSASAQSISNYDIAVKQGEKVMAINALLNSAIKDEDLDMMDDKYDELTKEVKKLEQNIGQVSGSTNRKKLANTYLVSAKVTIERVIYEVSEYRLLFQVAEFIGNAEQTKEQNSMLKLERLKQRAVAIKQAGGYKELPAGINADLREFEAVVQGGILDQYIRLYYQPAIDAGKIEILDQLYDNLTKQLKLTQQRIGQVSGAKNREGINEYYVKPAKVLVERTIYEVSQYRVLAAISNDLAKGDIESAKQQFATLNRLKDRAVKIKEAGGYDPLPINIEQSLRNKEKTLLAQMNSLQK